MPELAIHLDKVTKAYSMTKSRGSLGRLFGLRRKKEGVVEADSFVALKGVSLDIPKGQRLGIVGRNGAGKTTLLKLLCGNFQPTAGEIEVSGKVQALMGLGVGFHP